MLTVSSSLCHCASVTPQASVVFLTLVTRLFGHTMSPVGQYLGFTELVEVLISFLRRWKSADVPVFRMIADSYQIRFEDLHSV